MVPEHILEILACPSCKGEVHYIVKDIAYEKESFICTNCKLRFKVIDGIPDFLIETAEKISDEEIKELLKYDYQNSKSKSL